MQHHSTSGPLLAAGIDWLTATAPPDKGADELARLAGSLVENEREAGNRQRPWSFRRYRGLHAGGASFGARRDGVIVQLSGALAARWAPAVAELAQNVTRCDLQVTWLDPVCDSSAAVRTLWHERGEPDTRGRRPEREFTEKEIGSPYVYVGRRASDNFGRIYNKHADLPLQYPAGAVRAEVEAKGAVAEALGARVKDGDVTAAFAAAYTHDWYQRRGIDLPFPPGARAELDVEPRAPTDADRTMAWLAKAVAPGVARAIDWRGLWPTLKALGLDAAVQQEYGLCGR